MTPGAVRTYWYVGQDEGSGQDKEPDQAEIFTCVAHFSSFTLNHNVTGDRSQPLEHEVSF